MNLNPGQLATFAKVAAEEGSFSGAAAALSLTQPAVSNQMNQLSRSLGEPLFTRHRLGVNLTPAGLQLLPHAQALLRALESAGTVASELRGLDTGTVRSLRVRPLLRICFPPLWRGTDKSIPT